MSWHDLSLEQRAQLLDDKQRYKEAYLKSFGFVRRFPYVENQIGSVVVHYNEEGWTDDISLEVLNAYFRGELELPPVQKAIVDEWHAWCSYWDASRVYYYDGSRQLAYEFRVSGEQREFVCQVLSREDMVEISFGSIHAEVSRNCVDDSLHAISYTSSKGFFEDLNVAWRTLSKLIGHRYESPSTGVIYTDELIRAEGWQRTQLFGFNIDMQGIIEISGMYAYRRCSVRLLVPDDFPTELLKDRIGRLYPSYEIDMNNSGYNILEHGAVVLQGQQMSRIYLGTMMIGFDGDPEIVRQEMPRVLDALLTQ